MAPTNPPPVGPGRRGGATGGTGATGMTSQVIDADRGRTYCRRMVRGSAGPLVRRWRSHRGRSQLDLALGVGVSARHLSFVETGRSRPSPELIEAIGIHLQVPLRDRNAMLLAAGHAPIHRETPLDDPAISDLLGPLRRLLLAHDPAPGFVLDRRWDVVLSNRTGAALTSLLPERLRTPTVNVFRASLHPDGFAG